MHLATLIKEISPLHISADGDALIDISNLAYDSRRVEPGGLFFALRGERSDGHRFVGQAVARGAVAVVVEDAVELPQQVVVIRVANARLAMAKMAAAFHRFPTRGLPVVGVTGTNGKTTTTYLVESVRSAAGYRPAVFGTINYRFSGTVRPSSHTTPESLDLMEVVAEFRRQGADALVLEVSSHALSQHRVDGLDFTVGVFTNLTPEHLDYHRDMEGYFDSKKRLFSEMLAESGGRAVINIDDPYGRRLADALREAITFGVDSAAAAVRPHDVAASLQGITGGVATPAGDVDIKSSLVGTFNVYNLLGAAACGVALQIEPQKIERGLAQAPQVPGRMERIDNDRGAVILVDYAHTGDALEKALAAVKALEPRRIITVFGCGGDRDKAKRPVMGELACRLSDLAIVTSDNPRNENLAAILEDIHAGCRRVHPEPIEAAQVAQGDKGGYLTIADRREAIRFAVDCLAERDVLLIAGKGHETYQIVGPQTLHFDDCEEVRLALCAGEKSDDL